MSAVVSRVADGGPAFAVVGLGAVGSAVLEQVGAAPSGAARPRLVALCDSRRMRLAPEGIDPAAWRCVLDAHGTPADLDAFERGFAAVPAGARIVLDLTASAAVASRHRRWLARGWHVVTANKLAAASGAVEFAALRAATGNHGSRYFASATVGAGLPVLRALERLVAAGDRVRSIRGTLSGSLGLMLMACDQGTPFSAALRQARAVGLTEPDPRQDLSGADVARKLVIAARAAALPLAPEAVVVEDLVPEALRTLPLAGFLADCAALDAAHEARRRAAAAAGRVLRHVAAVERDGAATVGVVALALDDPLANLRPGDNCVEIVSDRYRHNPLVIRGAGAGPAVTAGAVLADLIEAAEGRATG